MPDSTGAWELPEEYRMLAETVREFMTNDVAPVDAKAPYDATALAPEDLAPLREKAKSLGLWCIETPGEYGGAGLNLLGQAVVAEEAAKCKMGLYVPACGAFGFDPPNIIYRGSPEQIEKYALPGVASGDYAFIAISEASGGSDPGRSIRTRAVRDGDKYILNGSKMWITYAGYAPWGVVFARTGGEGRKGITAFIVDQGTPGMTTKVIPVIRIMAPYEVTFEDCEVPLANRLGEEGEGFALANEWLVHGRVPYAANVIGVAQAALDLAVEYAREREVFGSKLKDLQAIQWMLADSEIEIRSARLLTWQAAWNADLGRDIRLEASIAKVTATEMAGRVVDRCMQIFGGLGVAREMPLERWYRELRIKRIGEGPSEVHRMVIARSLLR